MWTETQRIHEHVSKLYSCSRIKVTGISDHYIYISISVPSGEYELDKLSSDIKKMFGAVAQFYSFSVRELEWYRKIIKRHKVYD